MLSATRNFALGGFMTRPVNYDSTMLLRLSAEMKQAFYAACKARGVVPSEHARQLITDYVLNHAHQCAQIAPKEKKALKIYAR